MNGVPTNNFDHSSPSNQTHGITSRSIAQIWKLLFFLNCGKHYTPTRSRDSRQHPLPFLSPPPHLSTTNHCHQYIETRPQCAISAISKATYLTQRHLPASVDPQGRGAKHTRPLQQVLLLIHGSPRFPQRTWDSSEFLRS